MAGSTRYFGIGFFDFGDHLGTDFAGQIEIDRFVFIDKQLFGLMSIFGNGVIEGWQVTSEGPFAIGISEGYGNINFTAGRTTFPDSISDIPANAVNYVFVRIQERTRFSEDVEFILSPTRNINDPNFLLLSKITTGPLSIESIDNTVRQQIGFIELIRAAIRDHKHRGGSLNPSKIDLESEVKGQLPSFRIADFDAEKITTGTFDLSRLPLIDHQDLQNVGLLTHPGLDAFVKTLESSNKEIFGEIGTANLLQLIIALKLIHDDPDSAFYTDGATVDENMVNEFVVIPGVTPDSRIDFDATSAEINLEQHYIRGIPPTTGTSFYVNYDTSLAWKSAHLLDDVSVVSNSVTLAFNQDNESSIVTVENFETATQTGQNLNSLFTKQTIILADGAEVVANSSATNVIEGFYSGKFTHRQSFRSQFVKEYPTVQNWTNFDSFVINVKCIDSPHGPVKLYFEDSSGERSTEYILLDQNELTENEDPLQNDFESRIVDLSTVPFRDDIKRFVIFTDDLTNPFAFYVDFINLQRSILLPEEGTLVLRYSSGTRVTFSTLEWTSIEPSGTDLVVRARAASGTAFLARADYTPSLSNGSVLNLEGTDLEIEIKFYPDTDRISSPVLNSLRILILTEAEIDGVKIDGYDEFARGTIENITITDTPSVELDNPIYVGSYYFALTNRVNQIYGATKSSDPVAILGLESPIAPNTIFGAIEGGSTRVSNARLFEPRSVRREDGRTFVIADTYNDRVLEFNESGNLLSGFGSINYEHGSKTFPIAVCVDIRSSILYVVWSKKISFRTVNMSRFTIQTSTRQVKLVKDFDKILGLSSSELEQVSAEGQIMPVHLSLQNASIIADFPSNQTWLFVSNDGLSSGVDSDSLFYKAVSTALGVPVFIGNFAYIDGIFTPTWANKNSDGSFTVANGTVAVKTWSFPTSITETISRSSNVSSIVEVDKNNNIVFGSSVLNFSPFVPGRAERIDSSTLLIAGLKPGGTEGTPQDGRQFDFRSIGGDSSTRLAQRKTLGDIFFGATPFTGSVLLYDTTTKSTTFEYISAEGVLASDVDIDPITGLYVVAESSFEKSGRIIKIDSTGNIVFSFGEGVYSVINDVFVQVDGSIVIST